MTYSEYGNKVSELSDEGRTLEGLVHGDQKRKELVAFFKKHYPASKASEVKRIIDDIMVGCKEIKAEGKAYKKKKSA